MTVSDLREKIAIAKSEGATHCFSGEVHVYMVKKIGARLLFRPLSVFGTQKEFSWFENLEGADESTIWPIEEGVARLDEADSKREAKRTGQHIMF